MSTIHRCGPALEARYERHVAMYTCRHRDRLRHEDRNGIGLLLAKGFGPSMGETFLHGSGHADTEKIPAHSHVNAETDRRAPWSGVRGLGLQSVRVGQGRAGGETLAGGRI